MTHMIGHVQNHCYIEPPFYFDDDYNMYLGDNVYVNKHNTWLDIGLFLSTITSKIRPNVQLITVNHPLDPTKRRSVIEQGPKMTVKDDVWIDAGVPILPGVTVHQGATVAARRIVTRAVTASTDVADNPTKVIRQLNDTL
ncbi:TPA: nodulation protein L [Staphylococcus pseudintermedius]|nr:nodulation protein L [Staphylococcus pseudintermedius]